MDYDQTNHCSLNNIYVYSRYYYSYNTTSSMISFKIATMLNLLTGLSVLSLIAGLAIADSKSDLDSVNKNLEAKGANRTFEEALIGAQTMLADEKEMLFKSDSMIETLENFINLTKIQGDKYCNAEAFKILTYNDEATSDNAGAKSPRIVDRFVDHYTVVHSRHCRHIYPNRFQKLYKNLKDKSSIGRVESFVNDMVSLREFGNLELKYKDEKRFEEFDDPVFREKLYFEYVLNVPPVPNRFNYFITLSKMCQFCKDVNDPSVGYMTANILSDNSLVISTSKVKELFEKYILKPCEYFVKELGPELFIPAQLSLLKMTKTGAYNLNTIDEKEFNLAWVQYRVCNSLIKYQDMFRRGVIIQIIEMAKEKRRRLHEMQNIEGDN